ncbi:hypothetical protein TNCV_4131941 [Trichonephila clavipes]|nr:hypothetical protein TNCV_4131941 [Trichonephila clavipes]
MTSNPKRFQLCHTSVLEKEKTNCWVIRKIIFIFRIKTNKQPLYSFEQEKKSSECSQWGKGKENTEKRKPKDAQKESTTCVKFRTPKPTQLSPKGVGYNASPASLSDVTTHLSQPQLAGSATT